MVCDLCLIPEETTVNATTLSNTKTSITRLDFFMDLSFLIIKLAD